MTPFIQLPVSLQDHLLGVLAFIIYLQMAGIAAAYVWTRSRRQMLPFVLLFLFHLALLVLMTVGRGYFGAEGRRYPLAFGLVQCPLAAAVLYLTAAGLLDLFLLYRLWRLYQRSITKNSIKESADSMPAGLCFCQPDGMPLLVNLRMQEISHAYTGASLQNGLEFWKSDRGFQPRGNHPRRRAAGPETGGRPGLHLRQIPDPPEGQGNDRDCRSGHHRSVSAGPEAAAGKRRTGCHERPSAAVQRGSGCADPQRRDSGGQDPDP
jgi:hypothetical protein